MYKLQKRYFELKFGARKILIIAILFQNRRYYKVTTRAVMMHFLQICNANSQNINYKQRACLKVTTSGERFIITYMIYNKTHARLNTGITYVYKC